MKNVEFFSQDIIDTIVWWQKWTKSQRVLDLRKKVSEINGIIMSKDIYIEQSELDFLCGEYYQKNGH